MTRLLVVMLLAVPAVLSAADPMTVLMFHYNRERMAEMSALLPNVTVDVPEHVDVFVHTTDESVGSFKITLRYTKYNGAKSVHSFTCDRDMERPYMATACSVQLEARHIDSTTVTPSVLRLESAVTLTHP